MTTNKMRGVVAAAALLLATGAAQAQPACVARAEAAQEYIKQINAYVAEANPVGACAATRALVHEGHMLEQDCNPSQARTDLKRLTARLQEAVREVCP